MNIEMMGHPENTEMDFDLITDLGSGKRELVLKMVKA